MKRFLITAGPTREHIDTVRFISNASSGQTGFAIAGEAVRRGNVAVLVTGPTPLPDPAGAEVLRVTSADEMAAAVAERLPNADVVIGTAAVCDWRPAERATHKLSKQHGPPLVRWVRTPDIVKLVGEAKGDRLLIGFALEDTFPRESAQEKLRAKNMDYIVLNGPENLGSRAGRYEIFSRSGRSWPLARLTKDELAAMLVSLALEGEGALPL